MKLIMLCGPAGSGKSSYCQKLLDNHDEMHRVTVRISQDDQGKKGHMEAFEDAIKYEFDYIVIDRMNFDKAQRNRYLDPARKAGYEIEIVVFHVPRQICFDRMMERKDHPTINGNLSEDQIKNQCANVPALISTKKDQEKERQANSALDTFFTKYERVEDSEADKVTRLGWITDTHKTKPAILCDLDGTLCNIDHRLHYMKEAKKNWAGFFADIPKDTINPWCEYLIRYSYNNPVILCSGRGDNYRKVTEEWLVKHDLKKGSHYRELFMRHRNDSRADTIVKEIILEFEIKPKYNILMAIDDRPCVVRMWRKNGIVCLACNDVEF